MSYFILTRIGVGENRSLDCTFSTQKTRSPWILRRRPLGRRDLRRRRRMGGGQDDALRGQDHSAGGEVLLRQSHGEDRPSLCKLSWPKVLREFDRCFLFQRSPTLLAQLWSARPPRSVANIPSWRSQTSQSTSPPTSSTGTLGKSCSECRPFM